MPVTTILQGKTYTHGHGLLRAPGGAVAVLLPDGYTGRLNKDSIFKICSDDQRISCFLRFHDAATPLPRGWISEPFPLEGQQMAAVGPAKTKKGAHSRRFEGAPYVAYKAEKRDEHGNGISCSIAARSEHAATLTTFMRNLLDGALFGDAPAPAAPAPPRPEPSRPAPVIPPGTDPYMHLLLSRLTEKLCGKVLRLEKNQRDRDYSGGGFYYDSSKTLFLFADCTFRYEQHLSSRVSSGGLSQPLQRDTTARGTWKVGMLDGKSILVARHIGRRGASAASRRQTVGLSSDLLIPKKVDIALRVAETDARL
jgi:hypothetical protein